MQRSTSLDSGRRQRHMVSTIPVRTEGTQCNDNGNDEILSRPVPNSLSGSSNIDLMRIEGDEITSLSGSSNMDHTRAEEVNSHSNSTTSSEITNDKEKDFVKSIDTCLRTILIPAYIFLCGSAITAYTKQMLSHTLIQVIVGGMPISFITVSVLACLTSSMKNSNSPIDGAAFQIVQWLLLPVVLFPTTLFWMSLHFAVKMSIFFVCPLGSISDLVILFVWYWYIYSEGKKMTKGNNEDNVEEGGMRMSSLSH